MTWNLIVIYFNLELMLRVKMHVLRYQDILLNRYFTFFCKKYDRKSCIFSLWLIWTTLRHKIGIYENNFDINICIPLFHMGILRRCDIWLLALKPTYDKNDFLKSAYVVDWYFFWVTVRTNEGNLNELFQCKNLRQYVK